MTKFPTHRITNEAAVATISKSLKEMWPFAVGFGVTSYLMVKIAMGVTDEDVKASKFANPNQGH